jgi:hypothetical protein
MMPSLPEALPNCSDIGQAHLSIRHTSIHTPGPGSEHRSQERLSLHVPQTTIIRALVLQQLLMRTCLNNS